MTAPSPTDTWPGLLLDGLAGGLIGAAATIAVVLATIRHERNQREAERLDESIATAFGAAQAFTFLLPTGADITTPANFALLNSMLQSVVTAFTRAQRSEPRLSALLNEAADDLARVTQTMNDSSTKRAELLQACMRMQVALGSWLSRPDKVRKGSLDYAKVKEIADAATQDMTAGK